MCDPISVIAGAAVLGAGSSYVSGKKAAKAQKASQQQAEAQARVTAQRAEQDFNRANQRQPNIASLFAGNRRGAGGGLGSTFLTGVSGVTNSSLPLGGATLLGS